ncbi:MAG: UvrD-helicase domain-containing protein [Proteobacteria bacterium]|nr:UvrD-helicase domain-containing protein [Pseudomonadota bacterium]
METKPEEYVYLDTLNDIQRQAVLTTEGPLLVLAGAGTGKTRVLTTRIAHIMKSGLSGAQEILAVTFTNKAAREMKHRVADLVGQAAESIWIGTFHTICARILRLHPTHLGLTRDFTILDRDEQLKIVKQILSNHDIDSDVLPPRRLLYLIDKAKNKGLTPDRIQERDDETLVTGISFSVLYAKYQQALLSYNAVDFGDLIMYNIQLFNENPEIAAIYKERFKYILVDEYQDTNVAQYLWLRILAQKHKNICCVGDDDQSIYGWRGAVVDNILRFEHDYEAAQVLRLELNYRSTANILGAASNVIAKNRKRHGKTLWTDASVGDKVRVGTFQTDREEARFVASEIESLMRFRKHQASDIAILTRAGYQTRAFEESLNYLHIPYQIVGGVKFYERQEIRDALGYARLIINQNDNLAFERIVNLPKRGVGAGALQSIVQYATNSQISMFRAASELLEANQLKGKMREPIAKFLTQVRNWSEMTKQMPHHNVVAQALTESGYIDMWRAERTTESKERLDNIKELLRSMEEYDNLTDYLEHISLLTDVDSMNNTNRVSIMTMHAAKGLEFRTVFLVGWEEGIFPSQRALQENGDAALEEERRLAYVGITRAKERLYITHALHRRHFSGYYQYNPPSCFLNELPAEHCQVI